MNKLKILLITSFLIFSCNNNEEITRVHLDTFTKLFSIDKETILSIVG